MESKFLELFLTSKSLIHHIFYKLRYRGTNDTVALFPDLSDDLSCLPEYQRLGIGSLMDSNKLTSPITCCPNPIGPITYMTVAIFESPRRFTRMEGHRKLLVLAECLWYGKPQVRDGTRRQNALLPEESGQDCPDTIMRVVSQESVYSHLFKIKESRYNQCLIGKFLALFANLLLNMDL